MAIPVVQHQAFFHGEEPSLFVIKTSPKAVSAPRSICVVLGPGPQEIMRLHWGMRQLSQRISERGAICFRFDYRATGDSTGQLASVRFQDWMDDGQTLISHVQKTFPAVPITLIGFRLGGLIAAHLATSLPIHHLILVDPIWEGQEYLHFLSSLHHEMLTKNLDAAPFPAANTRADQHLGYILSQVMQDELKTAKIDLENLKNQPLALLQSESKDVPKGLDTLSAPIITNDQLIVDDPWKLRLQAFPQNTIESILKIIEGMP